MRTVILVLAAVFGILAAQKVLVNQKTATVSLLWFLLPIALGYAILQIVPFGAGDVSNTISTFPAASKRQLVVLASAMGLFLSSMILYRDRESLWPILFAVAISGFAVGFVGVLQKLGGNGKILWVYELLYGGQPFGPFVNRNNAAGFLILSLTGPIYFLARQVFAWRIRDAQEGDMERELKKSWNPIRSLARFVAKLEVRHLYCITAIVAITAAIFLSLSRGGSVSVVAALAIAFGLIVVVNHWMLVVPALIVVGCFGAAWWVEQTDAVSEALTSITEADQYNAPRLLHWQDALPYYQDYWIFGSGLGTYRYEYPTYQEQRFRGKFVHAENVYLETLAELGVPGIVALLITLLVLVTASVHLYRSDDPIEKALGVAGCYATMGVAASAALDFGIYQPANFSMAAILFGCIVGRSCRLAGIKADKTSMTPVGKVWQIAVLLLFIIVCGYGALPSAAIESAQFARREMALHVRSGGKQPERLDRAKDALLFAEKYLKDDWEIQFLLGQNHLYRHRQTLTAQVKEQSEPFLLEQAKQNGLDEVQIAESLPSWADYWSTTSLSNLHRVVRLTQRQQQADYLSMREDPEVVTEDLKQAWDRYNRADQLCDREERVQLRLAQLDCLFGPVKNNLETETEHMNRALGLAKGFPGMEYECGLLAMNSGNFELVATTWSRCLNTSRQFEARIMRLSGGLPAKIMHEEILPQDPDNLLRISKRYYSNEDFQLRNQLLLYHTRRVVEGSDLPKVEKYRLLGQAWFQDKEYEKSSENFSSALKLSPKRPIYRFDYAMSLKETGRFEEAIDELVKCQIENPSQSIRYARMIKKIKRIRLQQRQAESKSKS